MTIKVYSNIQDLTGIGIEYLVIGEVVIAEFFDGNLVNNGIGVNALETTK